MSGGSSADKWQIVADKRRIIRRPDFSPNEMNSFGLHISSSGNPNRNLLFQLHWNESCKLGFQGPFQRT
jgi:hypothetical protein